MDNTPILGLPYVRANQTAKEITLNEALTALEAVVQLVVEAEQEAPPEEPVVGSRYIVAAGPTDEWATFAPGTVLVRIEGGWRSFSPLEGWTAYDKATHANLAYQGGAWVGAPTLDHHLILEVSEDSDIPLPSLRAVAAVFVDASTASAPVTVSLPSGVVGMRYVRNMVGSFNVIFGGVELAPTESAWLWLDGSGNASR